MVCFPHLTCSQSNYHHCLSILVAQLISQIMWNSYQTVKALRQAEKAIGLTCERFSVKNLLRFEESNKLLVNQIDLHLE